MYKFKSRCFLSTISQQPVRIEYSYFIYEFSMVYCIVGLQTSLICLFVLYSFYFLTYRTLNDEIINQRLLCNLESWRSHFLYESWCWLNIIMELKVSLFLLILPCICPFFSLLSLKLFFHNRFHSHDSCWVFTQQLILAYYKVWIFIFDI